MLFICFYLSLNTAGILRYHFNTFISMEILKRRYQNIHGVTVVPKNQLEIFIKCLSYRLVKL